MQSFGPFVATVGTVKQVSIPPNSDRVRITNDSPYDVLVAFSVAEPTVVTQTGGDWQEVAPAWTHPTIAIPGSAYAVTAGGMSPFNGSVWLLPLDSGGLASTGTISSRKNLWVTAYAPGETATDIASVPRQQDVTSQNRVVAVPMAWTHFNQGFFVSTAAFPQNLSQGLALTSAQQQAHSCAVYLGYCNVVPDTAVAGGMNFQIGVQFQDGTHTPVGTPSYFASGAVNGSTTLVTPWVFAPVTPVVFQFNGNVPAGAVEVVFTLNFRSGLKMNCSYTLLGDVDPSNVIPVAEYGVQALYPSGVLF